MLVLLSAVLGASLLGSMHCVGMCGPLAIFASGAGDAAPRNRVISSTALYHLGRLTTYLIAGMIAGAIGGVVDTGGQFLGFQLAAARLVGSVMIGIGIFKIWQSFTSRNRAVAVAKPSSMSGLLVKLRPLIFRLGPANRALVIGLLTTLLPCGWLYLFALVAAGTGSMIDGPLVMLAFWLGTVPALTTLISGTFAMSGKFRTVTPAVVAVMLIVGGLFTASGRGFAGLHSLDRLHSATAIVETPDGRIDIETIAETPLPCCVEPAGGS